MGLAAAAAPLGVFSQPPPEELAGTPEQIHLTFGDDPATSVFVSWASPAQAVNPRVLLKTTSGESVVHAVQRTYTDGLNGQTVFTYHATLAGLAPSSTHHYAVTADNDHNRAAPFSASFRTAPRGRAAFRWTSYGDLATPNTSWVLSSPQSRFAVAAVETFQPLFHLLNGDLCYANLNYEVQPAVWADFGKNVQASAAHRPWMPCPGNHEIEFGNGAQGMNSYLTRYSLPNNGTAFAGHWYRFQVGSVLFISLSADDVIYQDSGAFWGGPAPLHPAPSTGNAPIAPGTSLYIRGYSNGAQTKWLEETLAAAAQDLSVDWIVVQMHQDALSSSNGNGSDKGIRESWLPLFDRYGVDLVLCGHDHDYERSWPVRGCNHDVGRDAATGATVDTCQPQPVVTAEPPQGHFDTRLGHSSDSGRRWDEFACRQLWGQSSHRRTRGQGHHQAESTRAWARARHLRQTGSRRARRCHLVCAPRHRDWLRHRRLRRRSRDGARQDIDHRALLSCPRCGSHAESPLRIVRHAGVGEGTAQFPELMMAP